MIGCGYISWLPRPDPPPLPPTPPQVLWGVRCTEKVDIYSFGVVLWEIITGEAPERGRLRDVVVPEECPPEVRALMLECLDTQPRRRPTAREAVERLEALPAAARPAAGAGPRAGRSPAPAPPEDAALA